MPVKTRTTGEHSGERPASRFGPSGTALGEVARLIERARTEGSGSVSLAGVGLKKLPSTLAQLVDLKELDLSCNMLTELPDWIGALVLLEELDLHGNQLATLPAALSRLHELRRLDVSDNHLVELPRELAQLARLTAFKIADNPHLIFPSPATVKRGGEAVLASLRSPDGDSPRVPPQVAVISHPSDVPQTDHGPIDVPEKGHGPTEVPETDQEPTDDTAGDCGRTDHRAPGSHRLRQRAYMLAGVSAVSVLAITLNAATGTSAGGTFGVSTSAGPGGEVSSMQPTSGGSVTAGLAAAPTSAATPSSNITDHLRPPVVPGASGALVPVASAKVAPPAATSTIAQTTSAPTATLPQGAYSSLFASFDNVGITADSATDLGNFDGSRSTYSENALTAAGASPGATINALGAAFTFPNAAPGQPDNTVCHGQYLAIGKSAPHLGFLLAGTDGPLIGTGTVYYTDGTNAPFTLSTPDWAQPPAPANGVVAITTSYRNIPKIGAKSQNSDIFATVVSTDRTKIISYIQLPNQPAFGPGVPSIHVFAITAF
jgi:hypothetical protein